MRSPTESDRARLIRAGEALYGPRWQCELARALDVNDRRVREWVAGGRIPPGIWADLVTLIEARGDELAGLSRELRATERDH